MNRLLITCFMILCIVVPATPGAGSDDDAADSLKLIFDAGLDAWEEGCQLRDASQSDDARAQFEQARLRFRQLIDLGVRDANVYFNLGHACIELDLIAEAIHSYRVAQEIEPSDTDIASTLQAARQTNAARPLHAASPTVRLQTRALLDSVIGTHRLLYLAVGSVVLWIGIGVRRSAERIGGVLVLVGGGVAAIIILSLMLNAQSIGRPISVVVSAEDTRLRKSSAFDGLAIIGAPAEPGNEFRIVEQLGDWYSVTIDNERTGWLHAEEVLVVAVPNTAVKSSEQVD